MLAGEHRNNGNEDQVELNSMLSSCNKHLSMVEYLSTALSLDIDCFCNDEDNNVTKIVA